MNISIIGFGRMAKAIATGLMHNTDIQLRVSAPSLPMGVNLNGTHTHHDNVAILDDADIIILAVKPLHMAQVLAEINPAIQKQSVIISIAAGLSLGWFKNHLPINTSLIRAMPNIAAAVGEAATPLIANAYVTDVHKMYTEQIFSCFGITTWAQHENDMDAFTALSGSGPAYVFLFIEALIDAAVGLGLDEKIAKSFALQTVKGAVSLAEIQNLDLADLRQSVTSPKGTTAAALQVFKQQGFNEIIQTAMHAACLRARELGM